MDKKNAGLVAGMIMPLLIIILSSFVLASGVSSPYWDQTDNKNPLYLEPGETKDFQFILQNGGGGEEIAFRIKILKGSEIATITDSNQVYTVPAGATDVPVNVRVSAPANSPLGTTYEMEFEFTSSPATPAGQLQFGSAFIQRFKVITAKKQSAEQPASGNAIASNGAIYIVIAIVVVAIIIYFVMRKRNQGDLRALKNTKTNIK